jgi:signal transduction histidine kinase
MAGAPPLEALIRLNHATVVAALVSGVVHDLNNALLVIGGSVELMEDGPLGENSRPRLERIQRQHHAMAARLRELGAMLKPERGDVRADLHAVVTGACALRETSLKRRGIAVHVESDGTLFAVAIAPDDLLQIVLNLLLNADRRGHRPSSRP